MLGTMQAIAAIAALGPVDVKSSCPVGDDRRYRAAVRALSTPVATAVGDDGARPEDRIVQEVGNPADRREPASSHGCRWFQRRFPIAPPIDTAHVDPRQVAASQAGCAAIVSRPGRNAVISNGGRGQCVQRDWIGAGENQADRAYGKCAAGSFGNRCQIEERQIRGNGSVDVGDRFAKALRVGWKQVVNGLLPESNTQPNMFLTAPLTPMPTWDRKLAAFITTSASK